MCVTCELNVSTETLYSCRVNAHLVAGVVLYLSYMSVRTSRVCICRHQEKHIRLHSHSVCYTPLKQINNYYAHFYTCAQTASHENSNLTDRKIHVTTSPPLLIYRWALKQYSSEHFTLAAQSTGEQVTHFIVVATEFKTKQWLRFRCWNSVLYFNHVQPGTYF